MKILEIRWNTVWSLWLMEQDRTVIEGRFGVMVSRRIWSVWACAKRTHSIYECTEKENQGGNWLTNSTGKMAILIMHSCVCVCNCRAMFTHCLSDIGLIPPCDRVVLEMEFAELCKWAVNKLRSCLLEIEQLCAGPQSDVDSSQQRLHKVSIHTHNTFH